MVEVFDNLIDNAFECVTELPEQERWIRVTLEAKSLANGETQHFMSIENPYRELNLSAIISQERYTTKLGKHQGVGLQRVSKIIRYTGGRLILSQNHNVFTVKVIYTSP